MNPLKDNSIERVSNLSLEQYDDLRWIADCPLKDLVDKDLNNVWLFPKPEDRYSDKICLLISLAKYFKLHFLH